MSSQPSPDPVYEATGHSLFGQAERLHTTSRCLALFHRAQVRINVEPQAMLARMPIYTDHVRFKIRKRCEDVQSAFRNATPSASLWRRLRWRCFPGAPTPPRPGPRPALDRASSGGWGASGRLQGLVLALEARQPPRHTEAQRRVQQRLPAHPPLRFNSLPYIERAWARHQQNRL